LVKVSWRCCGALTLGGGKKTEKKSKRKREKMRGIPGIAL
jgi:hypothetical protein